MLPFPFYLTAIFTQVYHLYGTNSSISITSGENYIQLQWPVTDINSNYFVLYGVSGNYTDVHNDTVTMPTSNETDVVHRISDLDPGELYMVEVHKDGVVIFKDFIATRPLPVQDVQLSHITSRTAHLSWSPAPGSIQDKYKVYIVGVTNTVYLFQSINLTEPYYNIENLQPGQVYNVTIVAFSHEEPSNGSAAVEFNTAPLPPLTVTVDAIDTNRLNITWQPDTTTAQDSYRIGYTYNSSAGNVVNVNITCQHLSSSFCEVGMPGIPGQVYLVRVYSVLGGVISTGTETKHSTIPLPVSNLQEVQANDSALHIQWTNPDLTLTYFENFIVMATSDLDPLRSWNISGDKNEIIIMDLRAGYFYNISVVTNTGYETSDAVHQTFYTYPKQVANLTNNPVLDTTTSSFSVHWAIDNSNNNNYDNFIIDITPRPDNSSFPITLDPSIFTYKFTDLSAGHSYVVSVVTKFSQKETEPVTQTFSTVPNKPLNVTPTAVTSNQAMVQWTPPSGKVRDYRLTLTQNGSIKKILTVEGTSHSFIDLTPGTQYSVEIESQSGGLYSEAVTVTVTTNPASVESLQVTTVTSYEIVVTWTQPQDTNFDAYQLSIDPTDVASPVNINKTISTGTYSFQPLKPGQLYTISISTLKNGSASETMMERAITKPLPVKDVQAVALNSSALSVIWSVNSSSQQSHFLVSYQELPSSSMVHELEPVPFIETEMAYQVDISGLVPGGKYKVMVAAWQNTSGEYAVSEVAETNGTIMPKPVVNLTATLENGNTIQVDWSAPEESIQDHYVIRHRAILRDSDALWAENSRLNTNFTLSNLFPGERYEIEVYAVKNGIKSEAQNISQVTEPLGPQSLQVLSSTDKTVILTWIYNSSVTYVQSWIVSYPSINGTMEEQTFMPKGSNVILAGISGLTAGYQYEFSVISVVLGMSSPEVKVNATTKPFINTVLSDAGSTNSTISVAYTVDDDNLFDKLVFQIENPKITIEKLKDDPNKVVTFTGLEAGTQYLVDVQTVSGEQTSEKQNGIFATLPNLAIVTSSATARSFTLTVQRPVGGVEGYQVVCKSTVTSAEVKNVYLLARQEDIIVDVTSLQPFTKYSCTVETKGVMDKSASFTLTETTLQAAPSEVLNLNVVETAPNQVTLTWQGPQYPNGEITHYLVNYKGFIGENTDEGGRNVTYTETASIVIDDLMAGYNYTFYVRAKTVEIGPSSQRIVTLKTYEPPFRDGINAVKATPRSANPQLLPAAPHKLFFNFTNAFSDKYGEITQYTVIISEDPDFQAIENIRVLPGWKLARQDAAIKAYQVIANCSDFFLPSSTCDGRFTLYEDGVNSDEYKVFEIGTEKGCESREWCNGPLKPDTTYYIALRAFTSGAYKDTPFSEAVRTANLPVPEKGPNVGGIVGGIVSALVAIMVVIIIVFVRRRRATKSNMHRRAAPHHLSLTRTKTTSCSLADFKEYVKKMAADSDFKYAEQFEELKDIGRNQACTAAELPCNRGKNRFTNILPYDHSRVKLLPVDDEEGSDYINANYIMGFNSKREYVVTQGPLPSTRDDFWRMLWEQNCRNIVMLTKCSEKGREKCDHYWPSSSDAVFYGDIQVAILNETVFPDWTITEFKVCLGDQTRQVRHFHFTAWPDFGVPKKPQALVRFVRTVRAKLFKENGPILVHCSAGVGRSGTFIVLDTLLQRIKTHDTVDIFSIVSELRRERVWMVQTEQQFICIHQCLLCVLDGTEDEHIYDNVSPANVNIAFEDDEGVAMT